MKRFEQELVELKRQVLDMAALAGSMVIDAWRGISQIEPEACAAVAAREPAVDRLQVEIDREAIRLIAVFAPVARDLRLLLMIARITTELERIGDEAVDTCEYGTLLGNRPASNEELHAMVALVTRMVHDAVEAFRREDAAQAQAVMRSDEHVDALYAQLLASFVQPAPPDGEAGPARTALILLARSLERIADHATNICEEVFYLVEGADIRHRDVNEPARR
jgi:phosphate transport system protein